MNNKEILLEKLDKMKLLIKELERTEKAEQCTHQLIQDQDHYEEYGQEYDKPNKRYFLVDLTTKKIVADGSKRNIARYIRLRKIDPNKILDCII